MPTLGVLTQRHDLMPLSIQITMIGFTALAGGVIAALS